MSFLARRSQESKAAARVLSGEDTSRDLQSLPALFEFLTSEVWSGGDARRPGTLLVFFDDGRIKACLSDRDQGLVLFVTCSGVHSVLADCDAALRDGASDWRPAKNSATRRSGR